MSRFFKEFGVVLKGRKHLFFVVLLVSIITFVLVAYGRGLKSSVDKAFSVEIGQEKDYGFSIEMKNALVSNQTNLGYRMRLNEALKQNLKFEYIAAYDGTAGINTLSNTVLAIDGNKYDEVEVDEEKKEYTVKVLWVDESVVEYLERLQESATDETVKKNSRILSKAMKGLFKEELDFDASLPALFGNLWAREMVTVGQPDKTLKFKVPNGDKMDVITNQVTNKSFLGPGMSLTLKGKTYELDNYIIVPLLDKGNASSENIADKNRIPYWCKIYNMKNDGFFRTRMTENTLQKEVNLIISVLGLKDIFTIKIKGADTENTLLFNPDVNEIVRVLGIVSKGALAVTVLLTVLYIMFAISHNQKYIYIAYLTGTGKVELCMIIALQTLIWAVLSSGIGFALYISISKLTGVARISTAAFFTPVALIALLCLVAGVVRVLIWDIGKMTRRV